MADWVTLSSLPLGGKAILREYPAGASFLRFREMGLLPGTAVTLVRAAPLGDPLEIAVRGYRVTLRRAEADAMKVEPSA
jgi:ferrous iron transport protein A